MALFYFLSRFTVRFVHLRGMVTIFKGVKLSMVIYPRFRKGVYSTNDRICSLSSFFSVDPFFSD